MTRLAPVFLLLSASSLLGGSIYGTLREGGKGVHGATVQVLCGPDQKSATSQTGPDGSYRQHAAARGRCKFQVTHKGQTFSTDIFSYDNPTRYDFDLTVEKGRYKLHPK